jgi:SsrA-binding protein
MSKVKTPLKIDIVSKKARFSYDLIQTFTAGIQLFGTEIKSIRDGKVNLTDGYCYFKQDELWVKNIHISEYSMGTYNNHEPLRVRKLLLHKRELKKLQAAVKEKGLTIIPVRIFLNEKGLAKLEISLARGKKSHDKRESIKERESKRLMDATMKARKNFRA